MVRSEDPPGQLKHLRFGKISEEAYTALIGFPGVKSVVLHTHGAKGEHPHWHVWWEGSKPITNQTIRNNLKKLPVFESYSGQNDWSFRNHDSFETWADYTVKNLSHKVLLSYRDIDDRSTKAKILPIVIPTPTTPVIPGPTLKAKTSKLRWDEKICHDAETRLNWKRDSQFSLASFEDNTVKVMKQVERQVFAFMRGRVNNMEAVKYCRNLLYEFGDDDVKDYLERKVFEKISWA